MPELAESEPSRLDLDAWEPWHPIDVRDLLAGLDVLWCVVAGWALDLFRGEVTRVHEDIEIAIPWAAYDAVRARLVDYELFVAGNGMVRPLASVREWADCYQTWVWELRAGFGGSTPCATHTTATPGSAGGSTASGCRTPS